MSFGDLEYQETTSNQLARLLKSMRQEQIILDAVQNPIDDVEEYPDARLIETQNGTKDTLGAVSVQKDSDWTMPAEPSYTTKLWLWFREGWRIKDHSLRGNQAFAQQVEPSPFPIENYVPIRRKVNDDGVTDGRYYGIYNGLSQYVRVKDGPNNRITDILESESLITFSIFFSPWQDFIWDDNNLSTIFSKIDDDQLQNAIRVQATPEGKIYYSLIYKGSAYQIETADGVAPSLSLGEFFDTEFEESEFKTVGEKDWQYDPNINPPDWTWLFFTFDKVTRKLKVFKVADGGFAATELVSSTPDETGYRTTVSMWIKGNEGGTDATAAYDTIGTNHAVFAADPNDPEFINGYLKFFTATHRATIANHASINTLGTFTIALKIRPNGYASDANADYIFSKGNTGNGGAATAIGGMKLYQPGSGSHDLVFAFKPNSNPATQVMTVTDAIPTLFEWYSVIITYTGATYGVYVNGGSPVTLSRSSDVFTNSDGWTLGDTVSAFHGNVVDFVIDKGTAWGSTQRTWYNNMTPGFKAGFPDWKPPKPPEPEEPLPVVRPIEVVYDLQLPDAADTVKVNSSAATTPFVSQYNVPAGTAATTTEVQRTTLADGSTGGGGTVTVAEIYNLAAASSTGEIENTERAYVQRIDNTTSILYNQKPTDLQFWVDSDGSADGTVFPCIFRTDGTYTKFGSGLDASDLGSGWVVLSGTSFVDRPALVVGDGVGVVWENNNNGTIFVRRGGTGNHDDAGNSFQNIHTGSGWGSSNTSYSIAGIVKKGGEPIAGSDPFFKMLTTTPKIADYQLNSSIENMVVTRKVFRVKRVGTLASATLRCVLLNTSNVVVATLGSTIACSGIGTTIQDIEFINRDNTVQWADGFRLALEYVVTTGVNSTNYIAVNYNSASPLGGTTFKAQYYDYNASFPSFSSWKDAISTSTDWAGHIWEGGATFTSYKTLDNVNTRVGEKVAQSVTPNISILFGDKLSKWNVILKKEGSPTGPIRVKVYNGSGGEAFVFNTVIDASALTTSDSTYTFTGVLNNFVMDLNSRIVVHYENGNATDKVHVKINTNALGGTDADGVKSILTTWNGTAWVDETLYDVSGQIFTGGVPDLLSRPKVAIRNDSEFGFLMQDKVTRCEIKLKKLGAPTGTYYIRSVRGSDGSNRDLLGSGDIASLSTSTWFLKDVSNYNALHYMGVSDKIVIEYEAGDLNNCLLVQVKKDSTYDDTDTRYEEFNGIEWVTTGFDTWDIAAKLYKGGDTYIPDAGTPYVEPPDYYDHDLLIAGGGYVAGTMDSFYGMRIRDFRIFTEHLTLEEIDTMYANKYSKRGAHGRIALLGWFTLTDQMEAS